MSLRTKQQDKIIDHIENHELNIDYFEHSDWSNFCGNVNLSDVLVLRVNNLESAQSIMARINELNDKKKDPAERITCRIAAGGKDEEDYQDSYFETADEKYNKSFSLTDLVQADVVINLVFDSEQEAIEQVDATTVRVRPGPQIKALDETLDKMKLATKHPASLINRVTPFGLAAVGGHGTGLLSGGYADNIKSITFLLMDGTLKKIDRISNPHDFDTIASAHLGLFGIVVEMELECQPAEKLECVETAMSLPDFLDAVRTGKLPRKDYPQFSVFYAPGYDNDLQNTEVKNVKVMEYKSVPLETEDYNLDVESRQIEQDLEIEIEEGLHVTDILGWFPQLVPAYMKYIVARFAIGEEQVISRGPAPFIYHYQVSYPSKINDFDCLMPVSDDFREMADAFEKVAKETQKAFENGEAPVTYGAYARLFANKKYAASIAPGTHHSDKNYVCGFDVVSSPGAVGFEPFRDKMVNYFIRKFGAKLHWGKYVPLDKGIDYAKMYGDDLVQFKKVLLQWHIDNKLDISKSPFLNEFLCSVLDMPEYMPAAKALADQERSFAPNLDPVSDVIERVEGLAKFLIWIEKQKAQDPHLEHLRYCVNKVHDKEINPEYYRVIRSLKNKGEVSDKMIEVMKRLKQGKENYWNPYWMNSGVKLDCIINALNDLENIDALEDALNDNASELYAAVNMTRLSPLTFLGQFGYNRSKSLLMVEEVKEEEQELSEDDVEYSLN